MKDLYDLALEVCRLRDNLKAITSGEIRKGHAGGGDFELEPSMRKTTLKDARGICSYQIPRLNEVANRLLEISKAHPGI
jgi:hypothetical protein